MENLLRNGDYVPDGFGGFVRLTGDEALLARALFRLTCRRGRFPFLPELGSRLWELGKEKPSGRDAAARLYAQQALAGMGLTVTRARMRMVSDTQAHVELEMQNTDGSMTAEVTV